MDHLACYLPANLALGVAEGAVRGEKAILYAQLAANLTHTCYQMYARMPTGEPCSTGLQCIAACMHAPCKAGYMCSHLTPCFWIRSCARGCALPSK